MTLGDHFYHGRKKKGLSQEEVAEKLGVSRQTISKWETGETVPDIRQAKKLAVLYGLSLDALVAFDVEVEEIQNAIVQTRDEVTAKVDWTKAWGKKYPILTTYQKEVDTRYYETALEKLLRDLEQKYGYDALQSLLVLKDILSVVWRKRGVPQ